jgi:DNA-directed RNA polymerase specialized sigma24 family protein
VAEDIVREVFMELWTRPNLFQGLAVSVALADSVRKRCLAYLRGRSDSRLRLWQAFDQLPRDQQTVITLSFAGYNWHEIAAQLQHPDVQVAALARSALQTLSATTSTQ